MVNYNIYGKTLGYEQDYPADTRLFLGCEYMPLRKQFRNTEYEVRERVEHILVTTGGGDSCHMALTLAERVVKLPKEKAQDLVWHIVCGPYCLDTDRLEMLAEKNRRLQIHKNVTDMSEIMKKCDIAVSAAGSTLYELCSVGVPTVGFYFAENQRRNMESFGKLTPVLNAGDFSIYPEKVLDFMEKEVEVLCGSRELRQKISFAMRHIVDGQGADRLAEELGELFGKREIS